MQIDDILLLRMKRQYLFAPAKDEFTVLRGLCGLQAQFYGNCLHALRLRCGKAPDEDILRTSAVKDMDAARHAASDRTRVTCRSSSTMGAAIFCVRATQWKMTTISPPRASASWPRSF